MKFSLLKTSCNNNVVDIGLLLLNYYYFINNTYRKTSYTTKRFQRTLQNKRIVRSLTVFFTVYLGTL